MSPSPFVGVLWEIIGVLDLAAGRRFVLTLYSEVCVVPHWHAIGLGILSPRKLIPFNAVCSSLSSPEKKIQVS